jgi:hypothetical protein
MRSPGLRQAPLRRRATAQEAHRLGVGIAGATLEAAWHAALEALRTINRLPAVRELFAARHVGFDHAIAKEIEAATDWITAFGEEFHGRDAHRRRA